MTSSERPPRTPQPRQRLAVRGGLLLMALAAVSGLTYLLATTPPTPDSFYPKCTMYQATGIHCPGCGTGRAVHAALNGRVRQAFAYNPVAVVLLPAVAVAVLASLAGVNRNPLNGRWILLLAVVLIVFTVLRNLPFYPLTLLAPHDL